MRAMATEALALAPDQEICMQEAWAVIGALPAVGLTFWTIVYTFQTDVYSLQVLSSRE